MVVFVPEGLGIIIQKLVAVFKGRDHIASRLQCKVQVTEHGGQDICEPIEVTLSVGGVGVSFFDLDGVLTKDGDT